MLNLLVMKILIIIGILRVSGKLMGIKGKDGKSWKVNGKSWN